MQALIERLQAASEGSRDLDAKLSVRLHIAPEFSPAAYPDDTEFEFEPWEDGSIRIYRIGDCFDRLIYVCRCQALPYTTSLDAALTLVPEGWHWKLENEPPHAWLHIRSNMGRGVSRDGFSETVALALCVAALKARMEVE